jgi:uncharacterized membrane protein
MNQVRKAEITVIDSANVILGAILFLTPWLFGFAGESRPAWNAWVCGAIVAVVALGALIQLQEWEEWLNGVVGLWVLISPWVLGFTADTHALWSHVILGILLAALAGVELWRLHQSPPRVTA